jgi:tetratricopeptide (TPR) repeat protein
LAISVLAFIGAGCSGSNKLAKKGDQLFEAGMYQEAATYYYNAVLRKRTNVEASIGLKNTGQRVFDDKLTEFTKAKAMGDHKAAVYAYKSATDYRQKLSKVGVELEAPSYMADDFNEAKTEYVESLYQRGKSAIEDNNYKDSQIIFKEIISLKPDYKDVAELNNIAINEPPYLQGKSLMEKQNFRAAYYAFDEVYQIDPNYKQAAKFRAECLDKGKFPVAVSPFENATGQKEIEKRINAFVISDLTSVNNPFLKVIDRTQMETILKEQRLGLSGVMDMETAVEAGNLLGAKVMITGTVLSYSEKTGRMNVNRVNGYEAYQVKRYDKATDKTYYDTRYKAVTYLTHQNKNEVSVSFQYKAISLETGEVLFSDILEKNVSSSVSYATYDGEPDRLFPAAANGVETSRSARKNLQNLIRANRTLKSTDQLSNESFHFISNAVSAEVVNMINQL